MKTPRDPFDAFGDAPDPWPSDAAKQGAVQAAVRAFRAQHQSNVEHAEASPHRLGRTSLYQGLRNWLRPTAETTTTGRRTEMAFSTKRMVWSGMATACVALVGIGVVYKNLPLHTIDDATLETTPSTDMQVEEVVVTGVRQEAVARMDVRREAHGIVDTESKARIGKPAPQAMAERVAPLSSMPAPAPRRDVWLPAPVDNARDQFQNHDENPLESVAENPVSTFSIDVDTSSYSFVRRQLNQGVLPQQDAVRIEELINYFDYDYPLPESASAPFKPSVVVMDSPWASGKKLVHIGIKGYELQRQSRPRTNLVFLLDVSGSMNAPDRLPLVKQSMSLLLDTLQPQDTVAIAVYAGAAGAVLEPTPVEEKQTILNALDRLEAGGSTAGAEGIQLAYQLAERNFDEDAVNRVILATDGDFNVGITNRDQLQDFVERQRKKEIFLSVLGFGQGNYNDHLMQRLAQNGNGVAAYIDTLSEAQKVLVHEATSALFPIAKDVKIQVEFNPAQVAEYRLLGYETRQLNREDFKNDAVDAGDIGAGHTVTAIYEITPVDSEARLLGNSRYTQPAATEVSQSGEYAFLKMRYKLPQEDESRLIEVPITPQQAIDAASDTLAREARFATAVAAFGQLLKGSKFVDYSYDEIIELAQQNKGADEFGYRTEFIQLVRMAQLAKPM